VLEIFADNISIDFKTDCHIMGSKVHAARKPRIKAAIEGAYAVEKVAIFKTNGTMYETCGDETLEERRPGVVPLPRHH